MANLRALDIPIRPRADGAANHEQSSVFILPVGLYRASRHPQKQ
eukprot:SAG31_NODE_1783_length_7280_cov_105.645314_3_plen_44_part_00